MIDSFVGADLECLKGRAREMTGIIVPRSPTGERKLSDGEIARLRLEVQFSFVRSSGPGGQNVNKVNSKALLVWIPELSSVLYGAALVRFVAQNQTRISREGEYSSSCDSHRDQKRNSEDCLALLISRIESALNPPKPRVKTKPTRGSRVRKADDKRAHSSKKAGRRSGRFEVE